MRHDKVSTGETKSPDYFLYVVTNYTTVPTNLNVLPAPEYVTDVWARYDFQCSSAHPRLEWEFEVFATPNIEAWVVGSDFLEEVLVDGEQTSGHCRWPNRFRAAFVPFLLSLGYRMPVELCEMKHKIRPRDGGSAGVCSNSILPGDSSQIHRRLRLRNPCSCIPGWCHQSRR